MNKILTGALLLAAFGPCAFADDVAPLSTSTPTNDFGALIGGAFTFGGDELAEYQVEYEDGDNSSENIRAGEQFYLFGGAYFRHTESAELAYGAQFNVGWFNNSISGDNGDVTLTRYPFELIPFIEFHKFRFGLGLTLHTSIEFEDDAVYEVAVEAEDASGTVFIIEYLFADHLAVGLRVVDIEYEFGEGRYSETFDAGHAGISASWLF